MLIRCSSCRVTLSRSPFFLSSLRAHRALHSFPTRRSSVLPVAGRDPGDDAREVEPRDRAQLPPDRKHTSELQSHSDLVCRLLLEKKKKRHLMPVLYDYHTPSAANSYNLNSMTSISRKRSSL